jgi:lipopolysaccharide/colanic/teichoic acid biosynthesis glycosyltransferase
VLFLGTSPTVARIAGHFAAHPELGLISIGYLENGSPAAALPASRLGTMEDLDGVLDEAVPDSIVIGNREDIRPWWADEFLALRFGGVGVQEAGTLYERIFARKCITEIWPSKAIFSDSLQPASLKVNLRSVYSWVIAFAAALITLPFTLTIATLIKMSSRGPVLTRETRVGLHDVTFEAYRFRCVGPDGADTPVGRFLRRHGLVWLPQLLNVLKGEMAMVGPRPERPLFARRMNELIPVYRQRHSVKPGVTGWARIHRKRGESQDSLRDLEYDLYYLENFSPLVDFVILMLSLQRGEPSGDSAI